MGELSAVNLILFVSATFAASFVAGLAGFAFAIVAAAVWLHFLPAGTVHRSHRGLRPDCAGAGRSGNCGTQSARSGLAAVPDRRGWIGCVPPRRPN